MGVVVCASPDPGYSPPVQAIVRRVLVAGRRDDALYVRGAEEPGSSGSSEADSDPDYGETLNTRLSGRDESRRV